MKIGNIVMALVGLLISSSIFAQNFFYCPEKVDCRKDGDISSCKPIGGTPAAWETIREEGRIKNTVYTLTQISGSYESPQPYDVGCMYTYKDSVFQKSIIMSSKTKQIFMDNSTKWKIYGYSANCQLSSATTYDCPFVAKI